MNSPFKKVLFVLGLVLAGNLFASTLLGGLSCSIGQLCVALQSLLPVAAMLMLVLAGVIYAAGQVGGQPVGVGRGGQRLLVPDHADKADAGHREQPGHPVEHPDPGPQHGHDQRLRVGQLGAGGDADRERY